MNTRLLFRQTLCAAFALAATALAAAPVRVVVWDEREAAQTNAYGGYLGDTLAAALAKEPDFTVKSTGLNEPEQGLSDDVLNHCDVLIWWGHEKHGQVTDAHVDAILRRLKEGKLGLIALHSAHWSKPFIAAMNARAVDDALKSVPEADRQKVKLVTLPPKRGLTEAKDPITPSFRRFTADDGTDTLEVRLPACVFSYVKAEGQPSKIEALVPSHPVAKGIPAEFAIPHTEVYSGEFSVPKPDAVVFKETWEDGRTFTSGCAWTVGQGKVFYFRPGHETYPIFKEEYPVKIVINAIQWAHP